MTKIINFWLHIATLMWVVIKSLAIYSKHLLTIVFIFSKVLQQKKNWFYYKSQIEFLTGISASCFRKWQIFQYVGFFFVR